MSKQSNTTLSEAEEFMNLVKQYKEKGKTQHTPIFRMAAASAKERMEGALPPPPAKPANKYAGDADNIILQTQASQFTSPEDKAEAVAELQSRGWTVGNGMFFKSSHNHTAPQS